MFGIRFTFSLADVYVLSLANLAGELQEAEGEYTFLLAGAKSTDSKSLLPPNSGSPNIPRKSCPLRCRVKRTQTLVYMQRELGFC